MQFNKLIAMMEDSTSSFILNDLWKIKNAATTTEVFSTQMISAGSTIGIYSTSVDNLEQKTELGQQISRSDTPNCELQKNTELGMVVVSKMDIAPNEVLTVAYEPEDLEKIHYPELKISPSEFERVKNQLETSQAAIVSSQDYFNELTDNLVFTTPWGTNVRAVGPDAAGNVTLVGYVPPHDDTPITEVDSWRSTTGIELLDPALTLAELEERWKNWELMTTEMKKTSDEKAKEWFNKTNAQIIEGMKLAYIEKVVLPFMSRIYQVPLLEEFTYYAARNLLMLLKTKVSKQTTRDVLDDVIRALAALEVRAIPLFKLQQLTVPSRTVPTR